MLGYSLTFAILIAVGVHAVSAQVTNIFLPGFDSQPLTMSELGAGPDGHTTFLLSPGTPTESGEDVAPAFTATYVVGPSDVAWYIAQEGQTGQDVCTIGADGTATCVEGGGGMTFTTTEQYNTAFPVQFADAGKPAGPTGTSTGTGAASAAAPSNTSGAAPSKMTTVNGSGPKTTAPTGTGSAPSSTPSNAGTAVSTSLLGLSIAATIAFALGRAI